MEKTILLFDVDNTITPPRRPISQSMREFLSQIRDSVDIGIVGGSDLAKLTEQLGPSILRDFDHVFPENGLVAYSGERQVGKQSIVKYLGEVKLQSFFNTVLCIVSRRDVPIKRGTFVELRTGLINVSPIGRGCSNEERDAFEELDRIHGFRQTMINELKRSFPDLCYTIGGQISFDVTPKGWDKTFCLQYLNEYSRIIFFGDRTYPGGNDHEISVSDRLYRSFTVNGPDITRRIVESLDKSGGYW
jgi:phosphomannomutase